MEWHVGLLSCWQCAPGRVEKSICISVLVGMPMWRFLSQQSKSLGLVSWCDRESLWTVRLVHERRGSLVFLARARDSVSITSNEYRDHGSEHTNKPERGRRDEATTGDGAHKGGRMKE